MSEKLSALNDDNLKAVLQRTTLFNGLGEDEIYSCLTCSKAESIIYDKGEMIFSENETPSCLPVLISGSVTLGMDYYDGKRNVITVYSNPGDIFGHEQILTGASMNRMFAQAQARSQILMIPKNFMMGTCERNCGFHSILITNLLQMMAQEALVLNERIEIMSCSSLRKKIAKMLLFSMDGKSSVPESMSRQEMADFLNVARPSLSRELMKMKEDGLIAIEGKLIRVCDNSALEEVLR